MVGGHPCHDGGVTTADIRAFRDRDWSLIERAKSDYWVQQKSKLPARAVFELAGELFRHARTFRPDWPDAIEREADLSSHIRVAAMLQRAERNRAD